MSGKSVLLIYMEPAPYILGLLECLALRWSGHLNVWLVGQNLSQPWDSQAASVPIQVLPDTALGQWRLLSAALSSGQYQLVHLAGWSGAPAFKLAMLLAAWHGVPCTVESDTPLPLRQSGLKALIKRLAYPWLFRLPAHFLPGGRRQAAYLREFGVTDARLTSAQMTVDVAAMMARRDRVDDAHRKQLRAALGCSGDDCLFLYVGRLEAHKGLQDLLDAFRMLAADSSVRASLLMVGGGAMADELKRKAASLAGITFSGRLAGDSLLDAYAAADVLVLPSHFEPWGLVVNEAMAAGLPVVVTDRVGCAEDLVMAGDTGLIVPAEDPLALGKALRSLAADAAARQKMGQQARKRISGWTLEHEADIIIAVWNALVRPA
jgi:glycosyltransferase involved in cell wall biosynthesis